jgi:hypothetical protein
MYLSAQYVILFGSQYEYLHDGHVSKFILQSFLTFRMVDEYED